MSSSSLRKFVSGHDYPNPQDIADVADRILADHGGIPGVAQSDIDLARYTPGELVPEPGSSSPFQAMQIEARDGGESFLKWLGNPVTLSWLGEIVGGKPLVFSTSLRKLGEGVPGPTVPCIGTSNASDSTFSVSVRLDRSTGAVPFELYDDEEGALARKAARGAMLDTDEAIAIRHDAIRCSSAPASDGLMLEFSVMSDPSDGVPLPDGWNPKHLAARRRMIGVAQVLAQPDRASSIAEQFTPPLRSAPEEIPLTRILAAPAPTTRLIVRPESQGMS